MHSHLLFICKQQRLWRGLVRWLSRMLKADRHWNFQQINGGVLYTIGEYIVRGNLKLC